jgi:hypothetical protein
MNRRDDPPTLFDLGAYTARPSAGDQTRTCRECGRTMPLARLVKAYGRARSKCLDCNARAERVRDAALRDGTYARLWFEQRGKCAVVSCDRRYSLYGKGTTNRLHLDHDHETGTVRGLLCHSHNVALGHLNDNPEHLFALVAYLTDEQWQGFDCDSRAGVAFIFPTLSGRVTVHKPDRHSTPGART